MRKLFFILFLYPLLLSAQQKNIFLNRTSGINAELFIKDEIALGDSTLRDVNTGFRPFIESQITKGKYGPHKIDEVMATRIRPDGWDYLLPPTFWNKVWRKINTENLI